MRHKRTSGYSERLQRALQEGPRPMSIRQLGQEMAERYPDLRGATYGGVRQYVAGNIQNPRVELLRAIAKVLRVRPDWLAFDEGAMTEEEERARRVVETASEEAVERERPDHQAVVAEGFTEGMGSPFEELGSIGSAWPWKLWGDLRHSGLVEGTPTYEEQWKVDRELARRIGAAVMAAAGPFGIASVPAGRRPGEEEGGKYLIVAGRRFSVSRWGHYIAHVCEALHTLLAVPPGPADDEPVPIPWQEFIGEEEETEDG